MSTAPRTGSPLATLLAGPLLALAAVACSSTDPAADDKAGGSDGDDTASEDDEPLPTELGDCDPTEPSVCGLPFPSTFHMREDTETETGWRIHLGATTMPSNIDGQQPAPTYWNERDGWSVATPFLAHFPNVDLSNVSGHDDIAGSLADTSSTIVIDLDTGERVAHWCERDVANTDGEDSLFVCRPAAPWHYGHHYVVAMRNLSDTTGAAFAPSPAFAALRDGGQTGEPEVDGPVELRRTHFDEVVFPALEAQGWSRSEVQLAWDFVTASKTQVTGRAVHLRELTEQWLDENGAPYEITEVETVDNDHTAYRVRGFLTAPLYTEEDAGNTLLTRDDEGMPYLNGTTSIPFTVVVPQSVVAAGEPAPLVQYGHGLLGGQSEVKSGYLGEVANRYGWILFAVDWTGMKAMDSGHIALMLVQDIGRFAIIPERSHQGFVEFQVAMRLMTEHLVDDPAFQDTSLSGPGGSLIDPSRRYYYGNSQGGILGAAYAGISKDFERAVLGVGGGPYHLLLTRSADFDEFFLLFQTMFPDPKDITLWLAYIQSLWDEAEGVGYARAVTSDPLPDTPPKVLLQQVAIGDAQVTTLGAEFLARGHGASFIGEPVREAWGIDTAASPTTDSVLVEWDYGLEEPYINIPPDKETDPHEAPRREFAAQEQMAWFFETGEIKDFCEGPCQDLDRYAE